MSYSSSQRMPADSATAMAHGTTTPITRPASMCLLKVGLGQEWKWRQRCTSLDTPCLSSRSALQSGSSFTSSKKNLYNYYSDYLLAICLSLSYKILTV